MNRIPLYYKILTGFTIAILSIGYFLYETYKNDKINEEIGTMVKYQLQITTITKQLFDDMQELESGCRGFIITGDEKFLDSYKTSLLQAPLDINILKKKTSADREKSILVNSLDELVRNKIEYAQNIVDLRRKGKINAVNDLVRDGVEKRLMDNISTIISRLDNESRNTLNEFYLEGSAIQNKSRRNYAFLSCLILIILVLFYVIIISDLKKREKFRKSLQEAGNEIRDLYDNAPSGYISVDPNLNILRINETALSWLDFTYDEISRIKQFELLVSPNSVPLLNKLKENENVSNLEIELAGRKNSLPVLIDSTTRKNDQGIILEIRIILTNISERKKAEEENRYLARLIDQTSDAIISTDKSFFIRSWNKGAEKMYGYTEDEVINIDTSFLRSSLLPEERKAILEELTAKGSWRGELFHHTKSGKPIHINISTTAVYDDGGNVSGFVNVIKDITQRKLIEEKIQNFNLELIEMVNHKTEEVTNILERITDGFASIDKDFNITYVNSTAAKIFGIKKSDVIGKNLTTIFAKEDNSIRRAYKRAFETQTSVEIEDYYEYFKRWYYFLIYPSPEGISFFFRDVTKRRESEDKLRESEKELRNSRDQLRLYSENLEKEREEERKYIAQEIHDELGQHLTGIKLDLAWLLKRLHNKPPEYNEKISGLLHLVDDTVKSVRRIALELRPGMIDDLGLLSAIDWQAKEFNKRSGITVNLHSDLNENLLDKNISIGVYRIFQEALTNVARHAQATEVNCTLTSDDSELNLTVIDNGLGLSMNGDKKKTLGLMGMYERALTMNGNLTIDSEPGKGTKINLIVPLNAN